MSTSLIITLVVIVVAFAILWWTGQLVRMRNYWDETMEELRKCSWPTWAELKGSTMVVFISIAIIGAFTVIVDWVFSHVVFLLT